MDEQEKVSDEMNPNQDNQNIEVNDNTQPATDMPVVEENNQPTEQNVEAMGDENVENVAAMPQEDTSTYAENPAEPSEPASIPEVVATPMALETTIEPDKKQKPKSRVFKIIMIMFAVWLFLAAPVGAYLWRDRAALDNEEVKNTEIAKLNNEITDLKEQLATEVAKSSGACADVVPSAAVIDNIKASITSGNTQALEGYMASGIDVILAASEGIGETTPAVATSTITDFIESAGTWDFALSDVVLAGYADGDYDQYFPDTAVVGKSSTGKVISFSFDCTAKIGTVLLSTTDEIL